MNFNAMAYKFQSSRNVLFAREKQLPVLNFCS